MLFVANWRDPRPDLWTERRDTDESKDMIPIPAPFVEHEQHLVDAFVAEAAPLGVSATSALESFKMLPQPLKEAPAFVFLVTGKRHYYFGEPLRLSGQGGAVGSPQAPSVENLVRAVLAARQWLSQAQLAHFLARLGDPGKHEDALVEMLAVSRVQDGAHLEYEPPGVAVGNKRIDWLIRTRGSAELLVEVKNRIQPLVKEMMRLQPGLDAGQSAIPGIPPTDFEILFRDTADRFPPAASAKRTQGVILFLNLKVPQAELRHYFEAKLRPHLHFVCLTTDGVRAHIEADSETTAHEVAEVLCLSGGSDVTF